MKKNRFYYSMPLILATALTVGIITACGGGKASYPSYDMAAAETTAASDIMYEDSGEYGNPFWNYKEEDMAPLAAPQETEAAAVANTAINGDIEGGMESPNPAGNESGQPTLNRKLIRTINLDVETTSFDQLLASLRKSSSEKGGYIQESSISGNSISSSQAGRRYAYFVIRIPAIHLDSFLQQVDEQSNITNRSENVQDVTLQYADIESRKKTLTVEQERLWALLEKADTLEAVIALEERLSEIRYELESFESQLRTYDNQVDYSTIYLDIQEVGVFTPTAPDSVATRIQKGFNRNLEGIFNFGVDFIVGFLSSTPILILLAIIFGAAVILGKILYKFLKKKFFAVASPATPITKSTIKPNTTTKPITAEQSNTTINPDTTAKPDMAAKSNTATNPDMVASPDTAAKSNTEAKPDPTEKSATTTNSGTTADSTKNNI